MIKHCRTFFSATLFCLVTLTGSVYMSTLAKASDAIVSEIAIVDIERILDEAQAAQKLRGESDAIRESLVREFSMRDEQLKLQEQDLVALRASLQADKAELESGRDMMSQSAYQDATAAMEQRSEAFEAQARQFQQAVRELRRQAQSQGDLLKQALETSMDQLRQSVNPALIAAMKQQGAIVLLDRSATLLSDASIDITDDVIERLDSAQIEIRLVYPPEN